MSFLKHTIHQCHIYLQKPVCSVVRPARVIIQPLLKNITSAVCLPVSQTKSRTHKIKLWTHSLTLTLKKTSQTSNSQPQILLLTHSSNKYNPVLLRDLCLCAVVKSCQVLSSIQFTVNVQPLSLEPSAPDDSTMAYLCVCVFSFPLSADHGKYLNTCLYTEPLWIMPRVCEARKCEG